MSPPAVRRIDPRTNRVAETIPIAATGRLGVAVGAGSVWAAADGTRAFSGGSSPGRGRSRGRSTSGTG